MPELTGIRVEMPGGSSLVNINSGKLETEVVFEAKRMAPIAKVLSSYLHKEDNVTILVSNTELTFQCGSSRLKLPRTR